VKTGFRASFAKDLQDVRDGRLLRRLREIIDSVEATSSLAEIPNLKKLRGTSNHFRIRVGEYRVGLALEDDTIVFVRFLNRRDIYRYFP
jgi:mRNA interferase RelE/StbE